MPVVQLEHPVNDYDQWKRAFDSDPIHREASGVRSYAIYRSVDDPNYVAVDLVLDDHAHAEALKSALELLWNSPQAIAALAGSPQIRIVDLVEGKRY